MKIKGLILSSIALVMMLFSYKALAQDNQKHNIGSDCATQVYYSDSFLGEWWGGLILNFGERYKITLEEYSNYTPVSTEKENVSLWWSVENNTAATVSRTESTTVSLAGKLSGKISAKTELITKEIGAEVSASYSKTVSQTVTVPAYNKIDVYTYTALKKVAYLEEEIQPQLRITFFYINTGSPQYSYGAVRAYSGAGTTLVYQ